jgi:exopolysaccharide biosynthesis polyprenyl glycosylphosphotransferase
MVASTTPLSDYVGVNVDERTGRQGSAPTHQPDVLRKLYVLARQSPPLLAVVSLWLQPRWQRTLRITDWITTPFTIRHVLLVLILMLVWTRVFAFRAAEGRNAARLRFLTSQLAAVFIGTLACTLTFWAGTLLLGPLGFKHALPLAFALRCGGAAIACVALAALCYSLAFHLYPARLYLIVGSRRRALTAYRKIAHQSARRGIVLGFIDPDASHAKYLPGNYLGELDRLEGILIRHPVDMVYLALPLRSHYQNMHEAIEICERIGVAYSFSPDIFETRLPQLSRSPVQERRGFSYYPVHEDYRVLVKRALDLAAAALLLCALAPLMTVIAAAIKLTTHGPVFFVQERYGRNRRRFRMYKFRSMVVDAEGLMQALEGRNEAPGPLFKMREDPRVTKVGRILRRSSLDELPQLFNVLKGDMSLVGPRPMSLRDVQRFSDASLMRRFSVLPGITGLWQVSGRSNANLDALMKLDLQYIDQWSLGLDLRILLRTVPAVLTGIGAA